MNARRLAGAARVAEWRLTRRGASAAVRARFAAGEPAAARHGHVLVAPPGAGNIGDQAMVEAYLENVGGHVVVVERHAGDVSVPAALADRVDTVALPHLIYGEGADRAADLETYRRLVLAAESVAVVGADMMDGRYSAVGSVRRALLAELAALAGAPTRVLGFSWNGSPRLCARQALRAAGRAGVVLVVRDPVSLARLVAASVPGVTAGSDVVFAARTVDRAAVPEVDRGTPFAVVNVSALVARSTPPEEYGPIVRHLAAAGLHVVLLPHVLRGSSDDLAACRAVARLHPDVQVIERALAPAAVRGLAGEAAVVVTGRMHLAIMAACGGVPAVTFSTQGKVRGLLELLGIGALCVEPGPQLAARVVPLLVGLLESDAARVAIAERLPAVRALADVNFPVQTARHQAA